MYFRPDFYGYVLRTHQYFLTTGHHFIHFQQHFDGYFQKLMIKTTHCPFKLVKQVEYTHALIVLIKCRCYTLDLNDDKLFVFSCFKSVCPLVPWFNSVNSEKSGEDPSQKKLIKTGFSETYSPTKEFLSGAKLYKFIVLIKICTAKSSMLILLDLSAAFHPVNHGFLLSTSTSMGITEKAHAWFESYLTGRSFSVSWLGQSSTVHHLATGVPQGSVLGPLLFAIHTTSLGEIIRSHGFSYHCYTDDTQLYLSFPPDDHTVSARISNCLSDISKWMKSHHLQLNLSKTELLVIQAKPFIQHNISIQNDFLSLAPSKAVQNLGVVIDEHLTFKDHLPLLLVHAALRCITYERSDHT
uniref:Reverse transcriptase domain-containing protein n=1 Tax=Nothobranchius furzeri TaxID=105023 RepID=A0A8C6PTT2_NOTFU